MEKVGEVATVSVRKRMCERWHRSFITELRLKAIVRTDASENVSAFFRAFVGELGDPVSSAGDLSCQR